MGISYDVFAAAFLAKIAEYQFLMMPDDDRTDTVDGYLKRAVSEFRKNCLYDLAGSADDVSRSFNVELSSNDEDELVNIISEGMVVQWMKPYVYKQDLLETVLNTKDFITYSPAELLLRVSNAYTKAQADYTNMIREYSYNHGDLTNLHI